MLESCLLIHEQNEMIMEDLLLIAVILLFFVLSFVMIYFYDSLSRSK